MKFEAQIQQLPTDRLIAYVNNVKQHPEQQIQKIISSIAEFGFTVPIVVDAQNVVIAGHGRLAAAQKMQLPTVPCIVRDDLTPAQVKALRIADNKVAESAWDDAALKLELESLVEMDFDLTLTGWDAEDLSAFEIDTEFQGSQRFGGGETTQAEEDEAAVNDLLEQAAAGKLELRTQLGELWQLGRHLLLVGDSTHAEDVKRLMQGRKAVLCWTDPPYNVDYDPEERAHVSEKRKANPLGKIANDKLSDTDFRAFLDQVYSRIDESLEPGCPIYISHADTMGHHFRNAFIAQPWKLQSCLIWKKTVLVFGRADYHWMHEPILYGWKEGASHRYYGDRKQTTILEFAAAHYDKANCDTDGYVHPTQKPTTLIEACLHNSTQAGDVVLDLFGGSGSTLIACEKTGRAARLCEIDPKFATVILNRWEQLTGQRAQQVKAA